MKILYLSCHSILEYDEVSLLTELGHEVHSHGVYRDPRGAYTLPRPGIANMPFDQDFFDLSADHPKTELVPEMIDPYDLIIIMSGENEGPLFSNWQKIKHKRVIWRSIGQSRPGIENRLKQLRSEGLFILRYSPKEKNIPNYAGEDAMIRFFKDPLEFRDWNGSIAKPINFTQTLRGRGPAVHYDEIMGCMMGYDGKIYGSGNNDLGYMNGGEVDYKSLKRLLRDHRVFVHGGTWPASYTLSFIEAAMTGIPIVSINNRLANIPNVERWEYFEVEEILKSAGIPCYDNIPEMRKAIDQYIYEPAKAAQDSIKIRQKAIELFGKEDIKKQWSDLLTN